ncbi:hypothetical protein HN592_01220 [Candidatus Woesearchaeota archaeon]|jgi:pheromone shutdown-related protein TraB|nr:hypothetical protein [Candidatus Woesearchaeota archaeon]MBT4368729.1 hypothetical protein [Candidatus Woesearchaeota archaeon]MBT4712018.1 hypothetical protein [Candidatus Woesearchaeota archaeon]MBT6638913.1 hypothetical protein [Candidatus Woesearchaeota archaeon]MBT7134557.1 hypothetical protein [Candidatus Woesearchaeota archaeon]
METKNLTILGTSHISKESINKVKKIIKEDKPDIVCLELDKRRFVALKVGKRKTTLKDIRSIGLKGWLFVLLGGWAEKKLGKMVGTTPGAEMMAAIKECEKNKIKMALVDQDIMITLKRFSKELTWKEKFQFVWDLVSAPFRKKKIKFNLNSVPDKDLIKTLIDEVKGKYPNVYKVLVVERNVVLARNIAHIIKQNPDSKIFAVIGAGHEEEVLDMIKRKFE